MVRVVAFQVVHEWRYLVNAFGVPINSWVLLDLINDARSEQPNARGLRESPWYTPFLMLKDSLPSGIACLITFFISASIHFSTFLGHSYTDRFF